jgi:hypothetical protein
MEFIVRTARLKKRFAKNKDGKRIASHGMSAKSTQKPAKLRSGGLFEPTQAPPPPRGSPQVGGLMIESWW